MNRYLKYITVTLLLLGLTSTGFTQAEKIEIVPKAFLILPENSIVKIRWIILPSKDEEVSNSSHLEQIHFCIDSKNKPIIAYNGRILMNLLTGSMIKINKPFRKMVCLESGAILFSDGDNLYYPELMNIEKGVLPEASLKPVLELPLRNSDIYIGDRDSLYVAGYNERSKVYEIFLFNPKKGHYERIATFEKKITALSGSGRSFFIASGREVWDFSNGRFIFYFEHPREEISELLYSDSTGLFYKTAHGIGFIKDGHAIEFLQIQSPEVFLKGTSLYIFFSKMFGLIELSSINDLKKYNFKIEKVIDIKKNL